MNETLSDDMRISDFDTRRDRALVIEFEFSRL
jgi:hypothetical protein